MNGTSQMNHLTGKEEPTELCQFDKSMSSLVEFRKCVLASLHQLSDRCAELLTNAGSGPKQSEWSAKYDPATQCSKTRQVCFDCKTGELGMESLTDWPRSGMIVGGMLYPLPPLVQGISGSESSYVALMPTATAADGEKGGRGDLLAIAKNRPNFHTKWMDKKSTTRVVRGGEMMPTLRANKWGVPDSHGKTDMWLMPTMRASPNEDRQTKLTPSQEAGEHGLSLAATIHSRIYADESVPKTGGMKMSPEFRCWFMGFPRDWLKPLVG